MFEGDRVRAWEGERWGYIDRNGQWIAKPQFTAPIFGDERHPFEVVCAGAKRGILAHSGQLILPLKYDDVTIFEDRAWVRAGEKLGLFALHGHWLIPPSIAWPKHRPLPIPTESSVSWFTRGRRWGLLSREGKVLFKPQFKEHVMGRKESDAWNHPEGLDFKNGRAWVAACKEYWLITNTGQILFRQTGKQVSRWTDDLCLFQNSEGKSGLISGEGKVTLPMRYADILPPEEGFAVITEKETRKNARGEKEDRWRNGYIDDKGQIVIEPGIYEEVGGELAPFSDGLAPVHNNGPEGTRASYYDPCAGYIDRAGTLVIPEQFYRTESFSEGLGAVLERKPRGKGLSPDHGLWGYVDKRGALAIEPIFTATTPFIRDRAWVFGPGGYAMIDRTGKALTDFGFKPPEENTNWIGDEYFGARNLGRKYKQVDYLRKVRWRGDLAVVCKGEFLNGLATADGKVLVEPIFNSINEFHDGVAVAEDSRGRDERGDVTFVPALITERGDLLAYGKYTAITDFENGTAWASHRWPNYQRIVHQEGWCLIDPTARELSEPKYVGTTWVWSSHGKFVDNMCPIFYGDLAPVALAEGYKPNVENAAFVNSWGYMDRSGKIVVWHDAVSAK